MARGGRIRGGRAGATEADVVNTAAVRGNQTANRPKAGGWRVAEPEAGGSGVHLPGVLAGGGGGLAGAAGRDRALGGAAAGVGA